MTKFDPSKTETLMLTSEIELLMADRQKLLKLAGAAAKFVEKVNIEKLPMSVVPLAEAIASSVNDLSEETLREALLSLKQK
ncbi:MAG: hypothetical protein SF172_00770 [Burkholderiales bacterium]|nr:hypothetical protein [Burkholderiales bacterium]